MKIRLDLSRHCIETAARLKVEGLIKSYFKTQTPETDRQIQALTRFLEQADFHQLRHVMAREAGQNHAIAWLIIPEDIKRMEIRFREKVWFPLNQDNPI